MNTQQLLNLSLKELNALSDKELREAVSTLRSTGRKRYERLAESEEYTPAVKYMQKSTKGDAIFPTVRNMDAVQLKNEFARQKHFLEMQTSTKTGVKKARENIRTSTQDIVKRDLSDAEVTAIWETVDNLRDGEMGGILNYRQFLDTASEVMRENPDFSQKDLLEESKRRLREIYEDEQRANTIYTSQFMQRPRN